MPIFGPPSVNSVWRQANARREGKSARRMAARRRLTSLALRVAGDLDLFAAERQLVITIRLATEEGQRQHRHLKLHRRAAEDRRHRLELRL
eukprot:COSAG04_NODE_22967_length_346_cov_0.809717_1_plen_90_part_10